MRLILLDSAQAVGWWSACHIIECIQAFKPCVERPFVLGLSASKTLLATYRGLIEHYQAGNLSFQHVVVFTLEEYVGLEPSHSQSHHYFMYYHFFNHVDLRPENIHLLNGMAVKPEETCQQYEEQLQKYGGLQLLVGGVSGNGSIAFNEPGSSLTSRTRAKTLAEKTRQDKVPFFSNRLSEVPTSALTIGTGTLLEAKEIMVLVSGYHKALALQAAVEGSINYLWGISSLQLHPKSVLICDEPATQELKIKTVNYFRALETDNLARWLKLYPMP
ncbi:MAG: glucosamine-6-phosphate deaminase [Candidatus Symbiodolus clandestinus]